MTEEENIIRNTKDTKDLSEFELGEKIRLVSKEVTQFDQDLLNLSRETYLTYQRREKRIEYLSTLRRDLKLRKSNKLEFDDIEL